MVLHNVVFDNPDVDQKTCLFGRQAERSELHLGREHPFWGLADTLSLSTNLKTVSCHLLSWLTL